MLNKGSSNRSDAIINYWLGSSDSTPAAFATRQKLWYYSTPETDNDIRATFGSDLASAASGDLTHWRSTPVGLSPSLFCSTRFHGTFIGEHLLPIQMMHRHKI